jgi:hypothetical protein
VGANILEQPRGEDVETLLVDGVLATELGLPVRELRLVEI